MPLLPERVLILAPNARDAQLTKQTLESRGLTGEICHNLPDFLQAMVEGAGLGLLAEESLNPEGLTALYRLLKDQPAWSDFPLIVIAAASQSKESSARRYNLLQQLGNLTILERPFHSETLFTAMTSALRSRRRQYEARSHLVELRQREDMITELNTHLEKRVIVRTQELTRSQEALVQAQRLEGIGRLAGGVAHDFNNLITGILGIVEEVASDLGPKHPHHDDLLSALEAANRAAHLTRQLLAFGRRQVVNPTAVRINSVVKNMRRLFSGSLPENVRVSFRLHPQLGNVRVDKSQLEQVLLNLVLNAKDAMPHGGHIKISSANATLGDDATGAGSDLKAGHYVMISVADRGSGIDAETMKHLFEPFYTTKKIDTGLGAGTGTGTGMGLATAYGLIKQHGGDIRVISTAGQGATFQIYLPRLAGRFKVTRPAPSKPLPAAGGSETILLTEDEAIVRKISVRALQKRGYHVIEAQDGREALKLSRAHSGPIDLLLTDVVMPGMNGPELAATVKRMRPGMRILFMSGYSRELVARQGILDPGTGFIEKAFSAEKLCHSVREILDQPGNPSPSKDSAI